jgi:hypothetical protein
VRQLLGELYVDKEYLEKLLLDEGLRPVAGRAGGSGWELKGQPVLECSQPRPIETQRSHSTEVQEARQQASAHI